MNAYTDGSSRGNPGPGGWAVIMKDGNRVTEHAGREAETTNNRMELTAVIHALNLAQGKAVTIHTDSQYVMNGATRWISGWKKNGWKTASRAPVLNQDLWEELDEAMQRTRVVFQHVRGHAGHIENERADLIATSFALGKNISLYAGSLAEYAPHTLPQSGFSSSAKGAGEYFVSQIDDDIVIHDSWSECQERIEGKVGRFKKAASKKDAQDIAHEWRHS